MLDAFETQSGELSGWAAVPRNRIIGSRLLACGLGILLLVAAAGCGGPSGKSSTPTAGAVSIPTGNLTAFDRCMLDAGWKILAVHSVPPGAPQTYTWSSDASSKDSSHCNILQPSPHILTDTEIRATYDRWVGERNCLVGLGYGPDSPPSFETFLASWNTGPWMPINGIDTNNWTDAEFSAAKARCTLEFFDRAPAQ